MSLSLYFLSKKKFYTSSEEQSEILQFIPWSFEGNDGEIEHNADFV